MTKKALLAAREALDGLLESVTGVDQVSAVNEAYATLALIDVALAQPEWAMPEPAMYYIKETGHSNAYYTEQQMREAFEAGRNSVNIPAEIDNLKKTLNYTSDIATQALETIEGASVNCNLRLRSEGKAYPRTCKVCDLFGKCKFE